MSKLKLGPIETDKPVRISIRLPAPVHRDLLTYAEALAKVGKDHPECKALCSPTATTTYPLATDRQAKSPAPPPANVTGDK